MSTGSDSATCLQLAPWGAGLSKRLLSVPGAFLWWYVDLVNHRGDGMVVIWSFGLPFLPGYTHGIRRGRPTVPAEVPSLNVASYRGGRADFYLLQRYEPEGVKWQCTPRGDRWRFGASTLRSEVCEHRRMVDIELALDVPAMERPVEVRLCAEGPGVCDGISCHEPSVRLDEPTPGHEWVPLLCACRGRAELALGDDIQHFDGRVYHDRNGGRTPFHRLGIDHWSWGRVALGERELIYYGLDEGGELHRPMWLVGADGIAESVDDAEWIPRSPQKNAGGLRWWRTVEIRRNGHTWVRIDHRDVVDSGPFYLRSLPVVTAQGRRYRGTAEFCEPARVDRMLSRPLVKMRVDRRDGANSMWLPLFCGPRRGRVGRLVRGLIKGWG